MMMQKLKPKYVFKMRLESEIRIFAAILKY